MNSDDKNTPITKFVSKNGERMISRRDVLKASWTVPVILAVTPPGEIIAGSEGRTPGYWKQGPNDRNDKNKKHDHLDAWTDYTPDDSYNEIFGVDASFGNLSLGETVRLKGGDEKALARHATAALLNATSPDVNYFYNEEEVIAIVQKAYETGVFETAKNLLEKQNELGAGD